MGHSTSHSTDTPLVTGNLSFHELTELVARHAEKKPPMGWYVAIGISSLMLLNLLVMIAYQVWNGVGVWGNNVPVGWGWPIVDFVFWVGIGHAGTLISAILFLFRQRWRTSINRAAEAMTIFAVICALLFPTIHVGRIWVIYWTLPIPNQMDMWPQFKSPLLWDVFAVSSYFIVSLLFWYVGMIPDLATLRDRARSFIRQRVLGIFSMGWTGSNRHWRNYEKAYLLLGRPCHAACSFGALGRVVRFCRIHRSRLAQHYFSALFRGWRYLFRVRHGCDAHGDCPEGLWH